jgi:tetratricopeptide (TPR) repeat protein
MENATGDGELDYVSAGVAEDLAARLARMPGLARVRSAARAEWPREAFADLPRIGRELGTKLGFRSRLIREGDSLGVAGEVIDLVTGSTRSTGTLRFTPSSIPDLESRLLAVVFGTVFRRPVPEDPRPSRQPVDPESYRLTLKGWQQLLTVRNIPAAGQLFVEATRLDPSNARAWAGVSSVRSSEAIAWGAPFEEGMAIAEAAANRALAIDSLQGTALANLGFLRGIRDRSLAVGDSLFARAIAAEPANAEIFLVQAALYRHAWQWDKARDAIRIARQLDPLSAVYAERESVLGLCAGKPELALEALQMARRLDPSAQFIRDALARALARLNRWDDALEVVGAKGLRGEEGYWTYRANQARPRLEQLLEAGRTRWISRARLGTLYIAAGEVDRGLDLLEVEARAGDIGLYRLPCQPDVDRVRDLPRFKTLLEFVGRTRPR